ncbi:MAG TPA: protein kinase [Pirellulales bacterium]|jgi:serine/threonine protein kinase|nr:protein kinase [Pirellulales bacterium]
MNADRNLLFGLLALQLNFVDRHQLVAAFDRWTSDKVQSLAENLQSQGAITGDQLLLLEALVAEHLKLHDNDPQKSLADLTPIGSARDELRRLADGDIEASLANVSVARADDPLATQPWSAGESSSSGTRFRILRPHARGGLGEVYVARDEELHREVALKEIQERHAHDPDSRSRFVLEAEITGGLEHPGIVPVYGLGAYADGRPFYAMRFIKGDSLRDAIKRFHSADRFRRQAIGDDPAENPDRESDRLRIKTVTKEDLISLDFRQLLGRFIDVCNAIEYAHSRGVLHRDLKPGNIMLGKYGETLVVDWGLAKVVGRPETHASADEMTLRPSSASGSAPTQMGSAVGTPQYMSPEQAEGRVGELGPSSDVYSLGATFYTLLTGLPPFPAADTGTILAQVTKGDFAPPSAVNSAIPRALEAICLKSMSLRPGDRYPTPRGMADDIEHWLADEPVSAFPETVSHRIARWTRRHRAWMQSVSAALLLVTIVSTAAAFVIDNARRSAETAESNATKEAIRADREATAARLAEEKAKTEASRAETEAEAAKLAEVMAKEAAQQANDQRTKAEANLRLANARGETLKELITVVQDVAVSSTSGSAKMLVEQGRKEEALEVYARFADAAVTRGTTESLLGLFGKKLTPESGVEKYTLDQAWRVPPITIFNEIVKPALELVQALPSSALNRDHLNRQAAALFAIKGKLIRAEPEIDAAVFEATQLSGDDAVFDAYDSAIRLDDSVPEYYVQRGMARYNSTKLGNDLTALKRDDLVPARKLLGDKPIPALHTLSGIVNLLDARSLSGGRQGERIHLYRQAVAELQKAVDEGDRESADYPQFLLLHSMACLELANFANDPDVEIRGYLDSAVESATRAIADGRGAHPELAYQALGNAAEDYGLLLRDYEGYRRALRAFDDARQKALETLSPPDEALICLGRTRYRLATCGAEPPAASDTLLASALADLQAAIDAGRQAPAKLAEAYWWKAQIHAARLQEPSERSAANEALQQCLQRVDQGWPVWPVYQLYFASLATTPDDQRSRARAVLEAPNSKADVSQRVQAIQMIASSYLKASVWPDQIRQQLDQGFAEYQRYLTWLPDVGKAQSEDILALLSLSEFILLDRNYWKTKKELSKTSAARALALCGDRWPSLKARAYADLANHALYVATTQSSLDLAALRESANQMKEAVAFDDALSAAPVTAIERQTIRASYAPNWRYALAKINGSLALDSRTPTAERQTLKAEALKALDGAKDLPETYRKLFSQYRKTLQ